MKGQETEKPEAPIGSARRILEWLKNNPLPEGSRRSAEEIDADIEKERNSWLLKLVESDQS
jgi:hypothetical protein